MTMCKCDGCVCGKHPADTGLKIPQREDAAFFYAPFVPIQFRESNKEEQLEFDWDNQGLGENF